MQATGEECHRVSESIVASEGEIHRLGERFTQSEGGTEIHRFGERFIIQAKEKSTVSVRDS